MHGPRKRPLATLFLFLAAGTLDPATCTSNGVIDPFFLVEQ